MQYFQTVVLILILLIIGADATQRFLAVESFDPVVVPPPPPAGGNNLPRVCVDPETLKHYTEVFKRYLNGLQER